VHIGSSAAYCLSFGSACTAEGLLGRRSCIHESQAAELGQRTQFRHHGSRVTDKIMCGVRWRPLEVSWSRCPEQSYNIAWAKIPDSTCPPGRLPQAFACQDS
jgi:hypothetical protein